MLHWWWFDEAVASRTEDAIGDENGSLLGGASWSAQSISGTSLAFDETGEIADLGLIDQDFNPGRFGLSLWFKRNEESFNWSANLISNAMVSLADENGSVLEIGSKGGSLDLFLSTEVKNEQVTLGNGITDGQWHFLTLFYDENASDGNELKVYLDGVLAGATATFGGSLKLKPSHGWLLGASSINNPSMGRFIGNLDDFRVFDRVLDESMHLAIHNDGYGDLSLTAVADYNASSESNPIYVNLTFKRYGQDWPVDFNVLLAWNHSIPVIFSPMAVEPNWTLEFNSTVNPGRLSVNILEGAGVEASGLESKPLDLQFGFGRPIVALEHLTAWWDFDEGSGTTVEDYMNGFIGSFSSGDGGVSNVTFDSANAKFGSALRFPTNAWVTTNAYSAQLGIAGGNPRTISFWLFAESGNDGNRGPYGIGQRSCPNSTHRMWGIRGFWNSNFRQFRSQHWCWDPDVWVSEGMRDKWMHIAHLYTGSGYRFMLTEHKEETGVEMI